MTKDATVTRAKLIDEAIQKLNHCIHVVREDEPHVLYEDTATDILEAFAATLMEPMKRQCDRFREALTLIASFREGPFVNSSFDEPGAARIARDVLGPLVEVVRWEGPPKSDGGSR